MQQDEEQVWIQESRNGHPEAFEKLVGRYQHMIHALTYRMTGLMEEAEDLTQETFIQAYRHLETFQQESRFSSWLYRISLNLCLNWQKRKMRRERAHREYAEISLNEGAGNYQLAQHVQEALLRLKPKQRAAVILTLFDGLSHAEAARALDCAETTVSWRVFSARRKLRRALEKFQKLP